MVIVMYLTLNAKWSCDAMAATAQISANEPNQVLVDWKLTSGSCCAYYNYTVWDLSDKFQWFYI